MTETEEPKRRATRDEIEHRIRVIQEFMVANEWSTKKARELAKRWGCAVPTVQGNACEASRRLTAPDDDDYIQRVRQQTILNLEHVYHKAMKKGQCGPAVKALTELAKIAGVEFAAHNINVKTTVEQQLQMPDELRPYFTAAKAGDLEAQRAVRVHMALGTLDQSRLRDHLAELAEDVRVICDEGLPALAT